MGFVSSYRLKQPLPFCLQAMGKVRTEVRNVNRLKKKEKVKYFLDGVSQRTTELRHPNVLTPWANLVGAKHTLTKPISCFVRTWNIFVTRRRLPNGRAMSVWEIYRPPRLGMMGCARGFGCQDSMPVGLRCTRHMHLRGWRKESSRTRMSG
jgi:hypothetical protein